MSLRSLALAYLASQQKLNDTKLSQRDTPRGVSAGQMALNHIKTDDYGVPAVDPNGTDHWNALQAEADRRNAKAMRQHSTARYCRCGSLAECAWPLERRRELWRCFRCLEPMGVA